MARKKYYIFNPNTLSYERVHLSVVSRIFSVLRFLFVSLLAGVGLYVMFDFFFESPRVRNMKADNEQMRIQYRILSHRLDEALEVMNDVQQRDDNLYRIIMQANPIDAETRNAGTANDNHYRDLQNLNDADLITSSTKKLDLLRRQLYVQSNSFNEIAELVRRNEERIQCMPAIQPISNKDLKRTASGYGWRIDPIYHTRKFHAGMDFSANTGTPVYATANGTVIFTGWKQGYGNTVIVDHGYNYTTLYGHLSKITTKRGKKVVRGEVIAEVGSTGKSTGPHLHYEVMYNGKHQNPINYYFFDLTPEDYDMMIQLAENSGLVMD